MAISDMSAVVGQKHAFQVVDRRQDVRLCCVEDRIAARFLIAARDERIQRERIAVGNGALFLDEDTEHARFQNWMIVVAGNGCRVCYRSLSEGCQRLP
jgi:hypothetical protein